MFFLRIMSQILGCSHSDHISRCVSSVQSCERLVFSISPIIHFPGNLFYAHLCSGKRWDWSSNRGLSRFTTLHLTPNGLFLTLYFQLRQELIMHPKGCHVPLFSNFHSAQFDILGGDGEIFREISGKIF